MYYTAIITKGRRQTLADSRVSGMPDVSPNPGEDIGNAHRSFDGMAGSASGVRSGGLPNPGRFGPRVARGRCRYPFRPSSR